MSGRAGEDNMSHSSRADISGSLDQLRSITIQQEEDSQQGQANEAIRHHVHKNSRASLPQAQPGPDLAGNEYAQLPRPKHSKHSKHLKSGSDCINRQNLLHQQNLAVGRLQAEQQRRPLAGRHASLQNSLGGRLKNSSLGQQELHSVLEQREEGLNEPAPRVPERGHFRRTHSSHSDQTYLRKDGLNTLSAYDTRAGLFGTSLTGAEKGHMNIVGEVDQDNEVDEENPQRKYKAAKLTTTNQNEEYSLNDIHAVVNQRRQEPAGAAQALPLMDSSDREHLANLKKQIIASAPEEQDGDPGTRHPKELQLRQLRLTHTSSAGSNPDVEGRFNSMHYSAEKSDAAQSDYNSASLFRNNPHAIAAAMSPSSINNMVLNEQYMFFRGGHTTNAS